MAINAGQINLGSVSIKPNYSDLGAFRVSAAKYGVLYSADEEIQLTTSSFDSTGPALELRKNGVVTTRVGWGGIFTGNIDCNEIYLSGSFWGGWSLTSEIKSLHNKVFGTNY